MEVVLILYMDDGLLVAHKKTIFQAAKALSLGLKKVDKWSHDHKIKLDPAKMEFMFLARKNKEFKHFGLTNQKTLTWLGVTFDSNMSWAPHLRRVTRKGQNKVNAIRIACTTKGGMTTTLTRKLVRVYILPMVTYGQIMWMSTGKPTLAAQRWLDITLNQAVGASLSTFRSTGQDMNLWLMQQPSMAQAIQRLWNTSLLHIGETENSVLRDWLDKYSTMPTHELIRQKDPATQAVVLFRKKGWELHMAPVPS
jgi:hypothetical protein